MKVNNLHNDKVSFFTPLAKSISEKDIVGPWMSSSPPSVGSFRLSSCILPIVCDFADGKMEVITTATLPCTGLNAELLATFIIELGTCMISISSLTTNVPFAIPNVGENNRT